jgi:ring-1,2-phenylacetyl-CoA epoxidase subunit PaaA
MQVIAGNGPCNRQRLQHHITAQQDGQWVRDAMRAYELKRQARAVA